MTSTKIAFFGSSNHSLTILTKLLQLPDFSVGAIITKSDKPVGRDQIVTANPVANFARQHHLPLFQPDDFSPDFKLDIRNLSLDIALCVAYGPPFFDQEMIDLFPFKIINIHPSPLPKYRGATPGPWQIINGETTSAVTFFQIDPLPDHGPILSQIPFSISSKETSTSFYEKAFFNAAANLDSILKSYIINHTSALTPQDHLQKTYFPKFTKETAQIDWNWDPQKIERFIRAMIPWPIARTTVVDNQGKILSMKILSSTLDTSKKNITLESVQIEGKKNTNWSEINKYYHLKNS